MSSEKFEIDAGFYELCFELGRLNCSHILVMNNAALPWFILIPETTEVEICNLDRVTHDQIFDEVRAMSQFVQRHFPIDKLNIACNGNAIRQMHLHVVGRRFDDYCWPGVVWGTKAPEVYDDTKLHRVADLMANDAKLTDIGYRRG